jgi:hypothetical protein
MGQVYLPYNSSATLDIQDMVITKDLVIPVYLTTCFALGLDHLTSTNRHAKYIILPQPFPPPQTARI